MIEWLKIIGLTIPLLLSGLSLIIVLKKKWLMSMDAPLDQGSLLSGKRIFGDNKTYRGLLIHISVNIFACLILYLGYTNGLSKFIHPIFSNSPILVGLIYSLSYTLGELINSVIKRQMGIPPGVVTNSKSINIQRFFDLSDGIIVVVIILSLLNLVTAFQAITAGFMGIALHYFTDSLMRRLNLKQQV